MIYILHDEASKKSLSIKGELHKYLVKVRRHSVGDELFFRNRDNIKILHKYKVLNIESRAIELELISSKEIRNVFSSRISAILRRIVLLPVPGLP